MSAAILAGRQPTFPGLRHTASVIDLEALTGLTLVRKVELTAALDRLDALEATVRAASMALLSLKAGAWDMDHARRVELLREYAIGAGIPADGEDLVELAVQICGVSLARLDAFRGLPRHPSHEITPGGPLAGPARRAATDEGD